MKFGELESIKTSAPYIERDLIWHNIGKSKFLNILKRALTLALIFFISFTLLLPANAIRSLGPLYALIEDQVAGINFLSVLLVTYFSTSITLLINNIVIPSLIQLFQYFEDYTLESSKLTSLIRRVFIFMLINFTIAPLTEINVVTYLTFNTFTDLSKTI